MLFSTIRSVEAAVNTKRWFVFNISRLGIAAIPLVYTACGEFKNLQNHFEDQSPLHVNIHPYAWLVK